MEKKKGFFKRAFESMKEIAAEQKKIDKENFDAVKADSKERFEHAKETTPDFQEFKDAEGLKEKAKVVVSHMERDAKEKAKENRKDYAEMLEEQRQNMKKNIEK